MSALEGWLAELRGFRKVTREDFAREPAMHHLAERYLHLATESVLDIAHHLIADQGWRQAQSNRDAIQVLLDQGALDADLARRLEGWMALRNVLVHLYLEIDHGRIHDAIVNELGDLESFAQAMAPLLGD